MRRPIFKALLLGLLFVATGCGGGTDNSFVFTSGPVTGPNPTSAVLTVSLDTSSPTVPASASQIQVEIFAQDGDSVQQLTVGTAEGAEFNLPAGNYLIRLTALDGNGNVVGYFDRVVTLTAPLDVVIPGLRSGTPPAVTFPDLGQAFFLFTAFPTQVVGGEKFVASVQAYSATGEVANAIVGGVELSATPIALEQNATDVTQSNGQLTFTDVCFQDNADGSTTLSVTAPGHGVTNSPEILVMPVLIRASMSDAGVVGDGGQGRTGPRTGAEASGSNEPFGAMAPDVSGDGRYTAFQSHSTNLVPGDTNNSIDVFVFDRVTRTIERVSVNSDGTQGDSNSTSPDISADGRLVVFNSVATNLVTPSKGNSNDDIYVHDRQTGETICVSLDSNGDEVDSRKDDPSISADGRFVAFQAIGDLLNLGGDAAGWQTYVVELATGQIELVSRFTSIGRPPADDRCHETALSADGNRIAFLCEADLTGDAPPPPGFNPGNAFVYDRSADTMTVASLAADDSPAEIGNDLDLSADGNFVVFYSDDDDIVEPNIVTDVTQVYVYDMANDTTELVSVDDNGNPVDGFAESRSVSADGRYVVSNVEVRDSVSQSNVYVYDRQTGERRLLSPNAQGQPAAGASIMPNISDDGGLAAFSSDAPDLLPGGNPFFEIFTSLNLFLR